MHQVTLIDNDKLKSFKHGDEIHQFDKQFKFYSVFNMKTGFYMRTGILDENGKDTGVDPFMGSYPSLIDVGIMGRCLNGEKGLCLNAGVQCYQNGKNISKPNMTLNDFKTIVDQCKGKIQQFALGGRGDPNKHEHFGEILSYCRDNYIVPNYTTSGLDLTDTEIELTKSCCGAVAISWYRNDHTISAIKRFIDYGCKTNIHYVLGNNTIDEAIERIINDSFPKGINAVIFLLHKPVGLGCQNNVIKPNDPKLKHFFSLIDTCKPSFKIGFDSCTVPGILNYTNNVSSYSIDSCEGGRYSHYISSDMIAIPCSFDQDFKWGVDLKQFTLEEAWNSEQFNEFRLHMKNSCPSCTKRDLCMGGCPIKREIVLCDLKEKDLK